MAGVRELKQQSMEGLLYLVLGIFFSIAHFLLLQNLPFDSMLSLYLGSLNFWQWLTILFAPSLIVLYLAIGLFNFAIEQFRNGLIKIYFGLTLICFLYMLGTDWAVDVKGIITIVFCLTWFEVELRTNHELL